MSILEVLEFPDKRLRQHAKVVSVFDASITTLLADMLETMYQFKGVGLAAVQVNIAKQLVVIDVSEDKNEPLLLVNPRVISEEGNSEYEEGCLSVPGFYANVSRPASITCDYQDHSGKHLQIQADGLLAVCIQHEIDHLHGKLFVDYLSPLKRQRIKDKMIKIHKQAR